MPELKYAVRHEGKVYCWDDEMGAVVDITPRAVPDGECPEGIVAAIVEAVQAAKETTKE
jgi:hypothetical protein